MSFSSVYGKKVDTVYIGNLLIPYMTFHEFQNSTKMFTVAFKLHT